MEWAAVILTGGTGSRLGGADKAGLEYAGRTLLERALSAVDGATRTVVVGPTTPTSRPVVFTREDPPSGGPAAGLLAGRDALGTDVDLMVVLAVDMPHVSAGTLTRLREAVAGRDGAFLVDATGRRQLAGALRLPPLDARRPPADRTHGLPLHRLLAGLDLVDVPARGEEGRDVDTWADVADGPRVQVTDD